MFCEFLVDDKIQTDYTVSITKYSNTRFLAGLKLRQRPELRNQREVDDTIILARTGFCFKKSMRKSDCLHNLRLNIKPAILR